MPLQPDLIADLIRKSDFRELQFMVDDFTIENVDQLCATYKKSLALPTIPLFDNEFKVAPAQQLNRQQIAPFLELFKNIFKGKNEVVKQHFIKQHFDILLQALNSLSTEQKVFSPKNGAGALTLIERASELAAGKYVVNGHEHSLGSLANEIHTILIIPAAKYLESDDLTKFVVNEALLNYAKFIQFLVELGFTNALASAKTVFQKLAAKGDVNHVDVAGNTTAHLLATIEREPSACFELLQELRRNGANFELPNKNGKTVIDRFSLGIFNGFVNKADQGQAKALLTQVIEGNSIDIDRLDVLLANTGLNEFSIATLEKLLARVTNDPKADRYVNVKDNLIKELCRRPNWDNFSLTINNECLWYKFDQDTMKKVMLNFMSRRVSKFLEMWVNMAYPDDNTSERKVRYYESVNACLAQAAYNAVIKPEAVRLTDALAVDRGYVLNFIASYGVFIDTYKLTFLDPLEKKNAETSAKAASLLKELVTVAPGQSRSPLETAGMYNNVAMILKIFKYTHHYGVHSSNFVQQAKAALNHLVTDSSIDIIVKAGNLNQVFVYLNSFWPLTNEYHLCEYFKQSIQQQLNAQPDLIPYMKKYKLEPRKPYEGNRLRACAQM